MNGKFKNKIFFYYMKITILFGPSLDRVHTDQSGFGSAE